MSLRAARRLVDAAPGLGEKARMTTSEPASPRAGRTRAFGALLLLSLIGLAIAGVTYRRYASVHLREPPTLAGCVILTWYDIHKHPDPDVAGISPRQTPSGETVYLRPNEDKAVDCLLLIDKELSARFTAAFTQMEPEARARGFLALLESISPNVADDPQAEATFLIGSASLWILPKTPAIKEIGARFNQLHDCRFKTKGPCPSRPPMPGLVLYAGAPSALLALIALVGLAPEAVRRVRARRAAPKPAST